MLPVAVKIDRAQRLVRMLEADAPLLALRVAPLAIENQQSAKRYASQLIAHARAELDKLTQEGAFWHLDDSCPQPAD